MNNQLLTFLLVNSINMHSQPTPICWDAHSIDTLRQRIWSYEMYFVMISPKQSFSKTIVEIFGVTCAQLAWLGAILHTSQCLIIEKIHSRVCGVYTGVSQGSNLGPVLLTN